MPSPAAPSSRGLPRIALLLGLAALTVATLAARPVAAPAKTLRYAGETVQVPASWPVYRLPQHPRMCVRLDRRAVYLGSPSTAQSCPAGAIGRRRAILVEPRRTSRLPLLNRGAGALRSSSGAIFTGLGFDACSAPSSRAMAAWKGSPYRALGVYIGGVNRACSQPNLTPEWVAAQTSAGWHLIPTYVGMQAPTSSCSSCAKLSSSQATAQGAAAALDAVEQAAAVAMGPGSPIYFDMESYSRTSSASAATLAFLEAWTKKLHALGYLSGVYSSSASGIADLAAQFGSGYELPDHIWIANWNGQQNTLDPVVPAGAWTPHRRIHQYRGGHDETYGGVTINIDNDYVDGATVGEATLEEDAPLGYLDLASSPTPGQVRVRGWAFDPTAPTETTSIRLTVGGKEGEAGAASYDLGAIASRPRKDVAAEFPEAGSRHGFDASLPVVKSGRQRVCAYALDLAAPGEDRMLGCKGVTVAVPINIAALRAAGAAVRMRLTCQWPPGTECPGRVLLRARFRLPVAHYRGHGPRTRPVSHRVGNASFHLSGGQSQLIRIPLSGGGRRLLKLRRTLKTQVTVAIPGGRRVAVLKLQG